MPKKAFHRLSWPFMFAILSQYGFSGPFIQALRALYSNPTWQVYFSSHLSHLFSLSNGTRQGCPLSPLLFIFSLEPLAAATRRCPDVKGVQLRQREYKLSLFADNVLLTLTHPHLFPLCITFYPPSVISPVSKSLLLKQKPCLFIFPPLNWLPSNKTIIIIGAPIHLNIWESSSHLRIPPSG